MLRRTSYLSPSGRLYAQETLSHVLTHCRVHSAAQQHRHNAILGRIVRALPIIVDVTFENGTQAFQSAADEKISKYTALAD